MTFFSSVKFGVDILLLKALSFLTEKYKTTNGSTCCVKGLFKLLPCIFALLYQSYSRKSYMERVHKCGGSEALFIENTLVVNS
jgi:hypothetical protein